MEIYRIDLMVVELDGGWRWGFMDVASILLNFLFILNGFAK
jgi:hypothetical protein